MCIQIANAARLALEAAARVLEPPPEVDYVEWAKDNIVFSERESPFPGRSMSSGLRMSRRSSARFRRKIRAGW